MPSADYLATLHADYRSRRGFAYGLDSRDVLLEKDCPDMTGLSFYKTHDKGVKDVYKRQGPSRPFAGHEGARFCEIGAGQIGRAHV